MIKRIILCIMCILLCLSMGVLADEVNDTPQNFPKSEMPMQGGRMEKAPFSNMQGQPGQTPPEMTFPDNGNMPQFNFPDNGNMPEFNFSDNGNMPSAPRGGENTDAATSGDSQTATQPDMENGRRNFGSFPGMQQNNIQPEEPKTFKELVMEYITPIISVVLLALAFVFVIFYKRKNY